MPAPDQPGPAPEVPGAAPDQPGPAPETTGSDLVDPGLAANPALVSSFRACSCVVLSSVHSVNLGWRNLVQRRFDTSS